MMFFHGSRTATAVVVLPCCYFVLHLISTWSSSSSSSSPYSSYYPVTGLSTNTPPSRINRPPRPPPRRRRTTNTTPRQPEDTDTKTTTKDTTVNRIDGAELRQRRHARAVQDPTLLTSVRFDELFLGDEDEDDADTEEGAGKTKSRRLHPLTLKAVSDGMGLQRMTDVQAKTYAAARNGQSIIARSKTGSGKTLAFLLPTLERILQEDTTETASQQTRSLGMIILAPTRELVSQIAEQAALLLEYHNTHRSKTDQLTVASIYGTQPTNRKHYVCCFLSACLFPLFSHTTNHADGRIF